MNSTTTFSSEALARVVAQRSVFEGLCLVEVPMAALCQVADELELLAYACRSKRLKGVKVMGAMIRMVDRLHLAEALVPSPRVKAIRYAIDHMIEATPSHLFVDQGVRLALRGLMREARSQARRAERDATARAAASDETSAEAAE